MRAVADVQYGPDPREWDLWTGYEAVFDRSFAHLPAWVLCSYSAARLPERVLEGVWRTHPEVVEGGHWNRSDSFGDPDELLRRVEPAATPLPGLRPLATDGDLETFRERLAQEMAAEGVPASRVLDLLLAATEVATNARTHGGGIVGARVGRVDGRFVCEIVDRGAGSTTRPPATSRHAPGSARASGSPVSSPGRSNGSEGPTDSRSGSGSSRNRRRWTRPTARIRGRIRTPLRTSYPQPSTAPSPYQPPRENNALHPSMAAGRARWRPRLRPRHRRPGPAGSREQSPSSRHRP